MEERNWIRESSTQRLLERLRPWIYISHSQLCACGRHRFGAYTIDPHFGAFSLPLNSGRSVGFAFRFHFVVVVVVVCQVTQYTERRRRRRLLLAATS